MFFNSLIAATRTSAPRATIAARSFHLTTPAAKSATEKVKEVADAVNKKVGQGLASAIETGENAAEATADTLGQKTEEGKQKANQAASASKESLGPKAEAAKETLGQTAEQGKQKANQAAAGAREAKEDFKKEVRK